MKDFLTKYNFSKKVVSSNFANYTEYENDIIKAYYTKKADRRHLGVFFKDNERARIFQNVFHQIIIKSVFEIEKGFAFGGHYVLINDYRAYINEDEFISDLNKVFDEFYARITPKKDILTA